MRVVNRDSKIIEELRKSGLSNEMKSLEFCKFLIIEEENERIVGATGIGGFFNVHSLQVAKEYHGKGMGKKLFGKLVSEAKHRKYSFILDSINPENTPVVKLVRYYGFRPICRINYAKGMVREVGILVFTTKGKIIAKILSIFNTLIGTILLAFILKITKPLFVTAFTLLPEEFPNPSILHIIKNFKKITVQQTTFKNQTND